ncbi:hypothetical protein [Ekhidna sp.]|uniref:DUF6976 family protein n=1 Tax=Ekhidna sp. TaxID=2608089 RepID=UPI0032993AAC
MKNDLYTVDEIREFIREDLPMIIGGDERLLSALPIGKWIGGSIHYFLAEGGQPIVSETKLFVSFLDKEIFEPTLIKTYTSENLTDIFDDYPGWGVSFIIIPRLSDCNEAFQFLALESSELLKSPLIGWVSGAMLDSETPPMVINGSTGNKFINEVVVMHCSIPENMTPNVDIINVFEPDDNGPQIKFEKNTKRVSDAIVNGEKKNLYDYLIETYQKIDLTQPLIANIGGSTLNTSIIEIDEKNKTLLFGNAISKNLTYQLSKPVENFTEKFMGEIDKIDGHVQFSCNCLGNFLHGGFKGKSSEKLNGLMTFGEIAYLPLNRTMVTLTISE